MSDDLFPALLGEEQALLSRSAAALFQRERDATPLALWQSMRRLGWLEPAGKRFATAVTLAEAQGQAGVQTPLVAGLLATWMLQDSGRSLPPASVVPAVYAPPAEVGEPAARLHGAGAAEVLRGSAFYVEFADVAEMLLVCTEHEPVVLLVPAQAAGVSTEPIDTSGGRYQFAVRFDDVACGAPLLAGKAAAEARGRLQLRGALLRAAELTGIGRAALALTVDYVQRRMQFGRPIGSFQAVHHHCADMLRDLTAVRLLVAQAATRLDAGQEAEREVAMAKAKASEAMPALLRTAHQLTGGVGYYRDFPLEGYFRRALDARSSYGDARFHRRRLAQLLRADPARLLHDDMTLHRQR